MFNLMIILLSTLNGEPKDSNNYRIAKYIIEHIHEMENCTLSQLAEKCYVSNSSISRLAPPTYALLYASFSVPLK